MKKNIYPICVILAIFFVSCYYDNEEALYPTLNTSCDTANVTFAGSIAQMLSNNCLSCHSNAAAVSFGNNIYLEDYADLKNNATAVAGSIKHTGNYSPMPKNGGQLKNCLIWQFDIWVRNGMLNN